MAASAPEVSSASEVGVKRSADAPPAGESPAKAVKVEPPAEKQEERKAEPVEEKKEEKKEELKDEKKEEVKKEEAKVKKENGEKEKDKEKKEKKEKKDKSEKSEKKEKKDKKDESGSKQTPSLQSLPSQDLDHRKLFKEGQRFLTPPMADSTRAFYESLYAENPESKIAIKFCVEYGLLPLEDHKRVLKKFLVLKEKGVYDMRTQIKRALEKKEKKDKKDKADKTEKKEKKEKDGEKKEKKDKAEPAA